MEQPLPRSESIAARIARWASAGCVVGCLASCDLTDARDASTERASPDSAGATSGENAGAQPPEAASPRSTGPSCITPRVEPPPPPAPVASQCPSDPDTAPPALPVGGVRFSDAPDAPRISVERALTDATRARGLMYRTRLDADRGMLFSWEDEEVRSFWMRNTCIPLDMLFIAKDGTIVGILEQVPTLNELPRSVPCPAQHVLEVNAGWTRQHGVEPGQRVEFET